MVLAAQAASGTAPQWVISRRLRVDALIVPHSGRCAAPVRRDPTGRYAASGMRGAGRLPQGPFFRGGQTHPVDGVPSNVAQVLRLTRSARVNDGQLQRGPGRHGGSSALSGEVVVADVYWALLQLLDILWIWETAAMRAAALATEN
jgi:hypothetical protein